MSEKVTWILITALISSCAGLLVFLLTYRQSEAIQIHEPQFKQGACFERNEEKEAWEKGPDGIIERVGRGKYLVMYKVEAESLRQDKYALSIGIELFDTTHIKVACPETWIKHTHKKH
jgi:hypothetical protein